MFDAERIKNGLRNHIDRTCAGCSYAGKPNGCLIEGLLPDALALIEAQERHIKDMHDGVVALRDAMESEAKHHE